MCSIVEDDFGDEGGVHRMTEDVKSMELEDEVCKKCSKEKSVIKLDHKESMCEACFMFYVRHKFRAALGSSKIVKRHSNVLLNFCGHPADVCLLHMIKFAFEQELFKRLYINLKIIFIDEYCTENYDVEKRFEKVKEIQELLGQFPNFSSSYSTISKGRKLIDDVNRISMEDMQEIIESEKEFVSTFNSLKSVSAKQDFLEISKKNCLRDVAMQVKCDYVFLPDISIDLAKKLISSIALGRGSCAANDVSFCDDSIDFVKFIRPIKDLNQNEIDHYIKFNDLKTISTSNYGENFGSLASIQNLTSKFIDGLQENYSSTVSTVFKCCNKIAPSSKAYIPSKENHLSILDNPSNKDVNQRCIACKSILDYSTSETLYAVEFSRCVSEVANDVEKLENIRSIQEISLNARNGNDTSNKNHMKYLCRGCRNIFTETNGENITKLF